MININAHLQEELDLENFLNEYNLDKKNKKKFSIYIEELLEDQQIKNKTDIVNYFEVQQKHVNTFIDLLKDQYKLEKDKKTSNSNSYIIQLFHMKLDNLSNAKLLCISKYNKAKEEINKKVGFVDKGPYLTGKGMVFPERSSCSLCQHNKY